MALRCRPTVSIPAFIAAYVTSTRPCTSTATPACLALAFSPRPSTRRAYRDRRRRRVVARHGATARSADFDPHHLATLGRRRRRWITPAAIGVCRRFTSSVRAGTTPRAVGGMRQYIRVLQLLAQHPVACNGPSGGTVARPRRRSDHSTHIPSAQRETGMRLPWGVDDHDLILAVQASTPDLRRSINCFTGRTCLCLTNRCSSQDQPKQLRLPTIAAAESRSWAGRPGGTNATRPTCGSRSWRSPVGSNALRRIKAALPGGEGFTPSTSP